MQRGDDTAVASAVGEILADHVLQSADHRDLFAGAPAVADQIDVVSARLGVPSTAATLLALSFLSIGCLDRVRVSIEESDRAQPWETPLHVWTLSELPSGKGKSSLLAAMGQPAINRFARQLAASWQAVELRDEDRREQASKRVSKGTEAERLAARGVLKRPRLRAPAPMLDQVTPEEYGWRSLQSGFTWIATGEGRDFFDNFVFGRESAAIGDLVNGFSGAAGSRATRKDTAAGNAPLFEEHHTVVALLCQVGNLSPAQPAHRQRLADAASRGTLARFVVGRPAGAPVPATARSQGELEDIEAAWKGLLGRFLQVPDVKGDGLDEHPCAPRNLQGEFAGRQVKIQGEAARRLIAFQKAQHAAAEERGRDDDRDPGAALLHRSGEVAIRIAGLLALARAGGIPALEGGVSVAEEEANRAIRFIERVHIPHGLSLLDQTTAGEVESLTTRILAALAKLTKPVTLAVFKNSHARRWPEVRGRTLRDKCPLRVVFDDLVLRGLVTHKATARTELYELSPAGRAAARW